MAIYDAYLRKFLTKSEIWTDEAEIKSKKPGFEELRPDLTTKRAILPEIAEKTLKNDKKLARNREIEKIARFSELYGSKAQVEDLHMVTSTAVRGYVDKQTDTDPNQAFRMHKQGSMDRLKVRESLYHELMEKGRR